MASEGGFWAVLAMMIFLIYDDAFYFLHMPSLILIYSVDPHQAVDDPVCVGLTRIDRLPGVMHQGVDLNLTLYM